MTVRAAALLPLSAALILSMGGASHADGSGKDDSSRSMVIDEDVPGGYDSWEALFAVQDTLDAKADEIVAKAKASGSEGYGSITISAVNRSMDLYWKGQVPASVQSLIGDMPSGLSARVKSAPYSLAELQSAMPALISQQSTQQAKIIGVGPAADASGLKISIAGDTTAARHLPAVRDSSVPIAIEVGEEFHHTASRDVDSAPYWGGAWWYYSNSLDQVANCSTGFAVQDSQGKKQMLTAAHCAAHSNDENSMRFATGPALPEFPSGAGSAVGGNRWSADYGLDVAVYNMTDAAPRIYRGSIGSSISTTVTGSAGTYVGDFVCTGGAMSGEHCPIEIDTVGWSAWSENGMWETNMAVGNIIWGGFAGFAVAKGDSGGPVFTAPTTTTVTAKGIIGFAGTVTQCSGTKVQAGTVYPGVETTCYKRVGFQPIDRIEQQMGVSLITSP
ncbi:hypothetical protein [Streptomyces sp. NBC_00233]|uniref:hypothetical protein n=1 Tax=Streptomyces sp. NBC_00233 TaxID=2975686 RepID=UPI00225AC108|nr:hypothetical protein [Streptomyces sp. NBC_00233]MCX5233038.1 S1 family peptidase [Streptomyces sp. NBC_00233]